MDGIDVLGLQLATSCKLVTEKVAEAEPYWTRRGFAGASLPGFIVWHCARIIDWGVNTVVRDVPELAAQPEWRERVHYAMGHGAGLTEAQADELAAAVQPQDVIDYAAALREEIRGWLSETTAAELDAVPDLRARNQDHPLYRTPEAWEEIKWLEGIPAWHFLTRPTISHIRVHSGELDTLLQLFRSTGAVETATPDGAEVVGVRRDAGRVEAGR
ncbi:MAG TPA: hypothetical protein VJU79_06275 [Candidatus Dormibacteraeota bacterium]|nr:hypothetical protein [Candidatus Dormibacteraeota bacterium]